MAQGFKVNRAGVRKMLRSAQLQAVVDRAADEGLRVFRSRARRLTGDYVARARTERSTGWDGRVAARIVTYGPGNLSQTFGAYGRRGDPALAQAAGAIGSRGGR